MRLLSRLQKFLALLCALLLATHADAAPEDGLLAPEIMSAANVAGAANVTSAVPAMATLIREFAERLPAQRRLSWRDPDSHQVREWSPRLGEFRSACLQLPAPCAALIGVELKYLRDALRKEAAGAPTLLAALRWSLVSELCSVSKYPQLEVPDRFTLCERQLGPEIYATLAWFTLGYDELFAAYYDIHEANRQSTIAFLAARPASDAAARVQRARLEAVVSHTANARRAELADRLPQAADSWLAFMLAAASRQDYGQVALALLNLARLSYRLNDHARGDDWRRAAEGVLAQAPDLKGVTACAIDERRALMQAARRAGPLEGAQAGEQANAQTQAQAVGRIKEMIGRDCAYSELAIEYAAQLLEAGRYRPADEVAGLALDACARSAQCSPSRVRQLQDLRAIARNDAPAQAIAARLRMDARIDALDAAGRRTLGVLARTLAERGSAPDNRRGDQPDNQRSEQRAEALALYEALDEDIFQERSRLIGVDANALRSVARYDEVSRMRVRLAAEQGGALEFGRTEALRGQSLLRRLRIKRWESELAGVQDAQAQGRLRERTASAEGLRKLLEAAPAANSAIEKLIHDALAQDLRDIQALYREQYLLEVATRKAQAERVSGLPAWMRGQSAGLAMLDNGVAGGGPLSLGMDEAYLSWIAVPGGYVGTLAAPHPFEFSRDARHRLIARYIKVSVPMAQTLVLYRKLLESGAGAPGPVPQAGVASPAAQGGASGSAQAGGPNQAGRRDDEGLELDGVTVWRLADGAFAASRDQPAGAVRSRAFAEISDSIHQLLLAPFQEELDKVGKLTISPDRELSYLPFETLTRNGAPVLGQLRIGYVQSMAVHEELLARAARRKGGRPGLLSVADPDYAVPKSGAAAAPASASASASAPASTSASAPASTSTSASASTSTSTSISTSASASASASTSASASASAPAQASPAASTTTATTATSTNLGPLAALEWEALPGTREESAGIAKLFPGARQWLGPQASRRQIDAAQRSGELARFRILHFATHGYVDDERSALVLSMRNGAADAYLLDTDVAGLKLDADLVLLSACNTGIGRNVSGEGVMGLPYAFLLAGNSNTLMSLWQVDDEGTAAFMVRFMGKVREGVDLQLALTETKREFAGGQHGAAFADPRVWGAFVQYGVALKIGN